MQNLKQNLNYVLNNNLNKIYDFDTTRIVIGVSIIFQTFHITKFLIDDIISPNLDKLNCLKIINDFSNFSSADMSTQQIITQLVHKCVDLASKNIFYLINNVQDELFSISQESLEEIIERYFESVLYSANVDNSLIMRFLMKSRNLSDIFDLLETERKKSIDSFERLYKKGLEPTIQWRIKSSEPTSGFYKTSEEFNLENVTLVLINYYDAENDVYSIALKISDKYVTDKTLKHKHSESSDSEGESDLLHHAKNYLQTQNQNPQVTSYIISLLSICEIKEINFESKINFTCIFSNTKNKVLACKIENFSKYFLDQGMKFDSEIEYTLSIYFNLSYNFSSILMHICKNFYEYHSLSSICKIPKSVLNIILKNENLNIGSEDEVLQAVLTWSKLILNKLII